MSIPSLKTIRDRLDVDPHDAVLIRQAMEYAEYSDSPKGKELREYVEENFGSFSEIHKHMHSPATKLMNAMKIIDSILDTAGVEYIPSNTDSYTDAEGLEFCNTGDTYANTVIFDCGKDKFVIGSWGDIVERDEKRFGE